ncbi:Gcd10p family protein [Nitzschia inconspicua]|uniref:tRNA (adenine(58)-N(1))-methyltransferase non-catalytic subunit TRM6 n=1 Tax=Nitzschia inconspicua TaxID=303405 RepID=A0A9K3PY26_9STRA|nr:Gcd10p family protein [Nitzschia inconspicua]
MTNNNNNIIREGDFLILAFADGRQIFAQAVKSWKGKSSPPVKINKRSYPTYNLIGLPYGTVLELGSSRLLPLPDGEDLLPAYPSALLDDLGSSSTAGTAATTNNGTTETTSSNATSATAVGTTSVALENEEATAEDNTFPTTDTPAVPIPVEEDDTNNDNDTKNSGNDKMDIQQIQDNRHLVDNNQSQRLAAEEIERLRESGAHGSQIVDMLIENSATFGQKTAFSKAKWIARKQQKHQPRCRVIRCTPLTVCEAIFQSRPRTLLNMREDSLGQILSYANISAGCQVLVFEQCMGVVTGALAQRMGGYGKVLSVYTGQQPTFLEMISRYNLSFAEQFSIKWVHSGDVFGDNNISNIESDESAIDEEKQEREGLHWPCPLQDHTRQYLEKLGSVQEKRDFLAKRCSRFARKLTRHTAEEAKSWLHRRQSDAIVLVVRYDPTETLLGMLPYLAPSSPFVVFCEYMEPLAECFQQLQKQQLAINLRLSGTWMREFQVLPGRTHPSMNMSQSGGYILTGIKLCPTTGKNELDEELIKEIKQQFGGRRGRKKTPPSSNDNNENNNKKSIKRNNPKGNKKRGRLDDNNNVVEATQESNKKLRE